MGLFDGLVSKFKTITNNIFGQTTFYAPAQLSNDLKNAKGLSKELAINFFQLGQTKKEIIEQLDDIKDFYFTYLIVDRIIEDALSPSTHKDLFTIKIKNPDGTIDDSATKLTEKFIQNFAIKKIINDIAFDLLLYGEYYLRLDVDNSAISKGIINIHDDVDITQIIPVYRDSEVAYYLTVENGKLVKKPPYSFCLFQIPGNRIKVKLDSLDDKIIYLRMGRSIVLPIYGLLKELKFLEELIPQNFINSMLKTKLIGIQVPPKTKPSDAVQISKAFQNMINSTLINEIPKNDKELLNLLKQKVGNIKVIPMFGDKGSIEQIDLPDNTDNNDLLEKVMDIRKNALITVGIPSSILDEEMSKADTIKNYIRYTKKLKMTQEALAIGIKNLVKIHLENIGIKNILLEDIEVNFHNIINTDDLERLEFLDLMVSMLDNFNSFISNIDDKNVEIDSENLYKFMNENFEKITGYTFFKIKKDENEVQE